MVEELLILLIVGSVFLLLTLILSIFYSVYIRGKRKRQLEKIEILLAKLIGNQLKKNKRPVSSKIVSILKSKVRSRKGYNAIANKLISLQNLIQIPLAEQPLALVSSIDLDKRILNKLKSKDKFKVAHALKYSYELGISSHFEYFIKNLNHRDRTIRREAQLGIVVFKGWTSFEYINQINYPISMWQIIRILDALEVHELPENKSLLYETLRSNHKDVALLGYYCCRRFKILNSTTDFQALTDSNVLNRFAFAKAEPLEIINTTADKSKVKWIN